MKRSSRLAPAVEMAKRTETEAAERLAAARKAVAEEEKRCQDLDDYYSEYQTLFDGKTQALRASTIIANREFLQQLAQSCVAQKQILARTNDAFEKAKRHWHQCYLKHENLKAFVENIAKQEVLAADKIEQTVIDEWVTQSHRRDIKP